MFSLTFPSPSGRMHTEGKCIYMKRYVLLLVLIVVLPVVGFAHSGGTDANGGHYNRKTGEYHYHHGYPEHQHPNGVCPYDYKNNTKTKTTKKITTTTVSTTYRTATPSPTAHPKGSNESKDVTAAEVLIAGGAGYGILRIARKLRGNS